jgi:hypothetical protein
VFVDGTVATGMTAADTLASAASPPVLDRLNVESVAVAVLTTVPAAVNFTTTLMVACALTANDPTSAVTTWRPSTVDSEADPVDDDTDTNRMPDARWSVTTTSFAASGPASVTVIVYVPSVPTFGEESDTTFDRCNSAYAGESETVFELRLVPPVASDVCCVKLTVFVTRDVVPTSTTICRVAELWSPAGARFGTVQVTFCPETDTVPRDAEDDSYVSPLASTSVATTLPDAAGPALDALTVNVSSLPSCGVVVDADLVRVTAAYGGVTTTELDDPVVCPDPFGFVCVKLAVFVAGCDDATATTICSVAEAPIASSVIVHTTVCPVTMTHAVGQVFEAVDDT